MASRSKGPEGNTALLLLVLMLPMRTLALASKRVHTLNCIRSFNSPVLQGSMIISGPAGLSHSHFLHPEVQLATFAGLGCASVFCGVATLVLLQKAEMAYELQSKLLKGGYIGDYIGDYYRGY